jgi:hypothetical protein
MAEQVPTGACSSTAAKKARETSCSSSRYPFLLKLEWSKASSSTFRSNGP